MRTKRLAARTVTKRLRQVRTRMEQIRSENYTGLPRAFVFVQFLLRTGCVIFSCSTGLCYSPSGLVVFQYSAHPRLPLTSLYSSACDLKNNHLVSSRRLSTTFSMHLEDRGGQESCRRRCERGGVLKSKKLCETFTSSLTLITRLCHLSAMGGFQTIIRLHAEPSLDGEL